MNDLLTLGIETSGNIASVAICNECEVLGSVSIKTRLTHSQVILPLVKKLLSDTELSMDNIGLIAVANGPGSYTGLRIGIAAVKGMCLALGTKCIGVSTLEELAYNVCSTKATVLSVLKARKGVVYFGAYKADGQNVKRVYEDRVCELCEVKAFADATEGDIIIVGDCCDEIKSELFPQDDRIAVAHPKDRLQNATSVCFVGINKNEYIDAERLEAVYLQNTKAEKDKAHKDN